MTDNTSHKGCQVIGGVDTHKELHVAAMVDEHDHVLGKKFFPATRHEYKQMASWMRSFCAINPALLPAHADVDVMQKG